MSLCCTCCQPAARITFSRSRRATVSIDAGEYAATRADAKPSEWLAVQRSSSLVTLEDTRALRVGDIAMIKINENAQASGDATTNLKKETSRSASVDAICSGSMPGHEEGLPEHRPGAT